MSHPPTATDEAIVPTSPASAAGTAGELRVGSGRATLLMMGLFAALAFGAVLLTTGGPYGPGASADSVTYLSVAERLASGGGFFRFDGRPYIAWPPLYPMMLSVGVVTGLSPMDSARALHGILFAVTLASLVGLLARSCGGLGWAAWGGILAFCSPRVLRATSTVWSEVPLITFFTLACFLAARCKGAPQRRDVLLLGVVAGAAMTTRHLGVALVGALAIWLLMGAGSWRDRFGRVLLLGATSSVGPVLWLLRNQLMWGTNTGTRSGAYTSIGRNVSDFLLNVRVYLGTPAGDGERVIAGAILAGVPLVALGIALWLRRKGRSVPAPVLISAVFLLLYSSALLIGASLSPVASLKGIRFGAPVWLPLVVMVVVGTSALWQRWPSRIARVCVAGVILLYTVPAVGAIPEIVKGARQRGVSGIARAYWHHSELIDAVRKTDVGLRVVSNRPHEVYLHTSIPTRMAPSAHNYRSRTPRTQDFKVLREQIQREGAVKLAWFGDYTRSNGYHRPRTIRKFGFCVDGEGSFTDGELYRITLGEHCKPTK